MSRRLVLVVVAACSSKPPDTPPDIPPAGVTIGGAVHNLTGSGLVLALDDGSTLPIVANGSFQFPHEKLAGATYRVTIATQPDHQTCVIRDAAGTVGSTAITAVTVVCAIGALRITELSNCFYTTVACWLELANTSTLPVELSSYALRSSAIARADASVDVVHTFPLPSYAIPPGGRVVLRGRTSDALGSGRNLFSLVDEDYVPFWYTQGFAELVLAGKTADAVRIGEDATAVTSYGWVGAGAPPAASMVYGGVIARDEADADTDTAADWHVHAFATPGGPNDITSDADTDADGIPDQAELPGSTYASLDLYAMGVRVNQPDILIEVDRMDSTEAGTIPRKQSFDRLVAAFLPHGIHIHPDVGDLFSATFDPAQYNLGGGNDLVPFETLTIFDEIYGYKALHMDVRMQQIAHYLVYVNTLENAGGYAELGGNDLLVAFSTGQLDTSTPAMANRLYNFQAAVMMHELGHNLGLQHGGDEEHNYKPNYLSVMNYLYCYNGVPNVGNDEGDRYALGVCHVGDETTIVNGPQTSSYKLDYSNGTGGALDEISLVESQGLRRASSVAVDFNCDHTIATSSYDIDGDGRIGGSMNDHDDWSALDLPFNRLFQGTASGWRPIGGEIRPVADEHGMATPRPHRAAPP